MSIHEVGVRRAMSECGGRGPPGEYAWRDYGRLCNQKKAEVFVALCFFALNNVMNDKGRGYIVAGRYERSRSKKVNRKLRQQKRDKMTTTT